LSSTGVVALPIAHNIFSLTPRPFGLTRDDLLTETAQLAKKAPEERLGELDQPEKDRVFGIAQTFVEGHVRRIAKGHAIRTTHPNFDVGTIVVSQNRVPTSKTRHARFEWAITPEGVVGLKDARLPVGHLARLPLKPEPSFASVHHGDDSDVAFLLAFVCKLLGIDAPSPIAGIGALDSDYHFILYEQDVDMYLDGARRDHVDHVVLPFNNGKMSGSYDGVRYWPARDSNEAIWALLSALSNEVFIPNIHRRAMTKQAYSWLSLVLILLAVCGYRLAVSLGSHPPVTFVRYLLGAVAILFVGSMTCVHRFWRLDR
jgi:hypothetical protein